MVALESQAATDSHACHKHSSEETQESICSEAQKQATREKDDFNINISLRRLFEWLPLLSCN
eukprot:m.21163 g.21163  ORF g.21163 m.21163 type:complete len:62 (+) comp28147_c0_seq1:1911-2096(+)